jgi:hypothetical protein
MSGSVAAPKKPLIHPEALNILTKLPQADMVTIMKHMAAEGDNQNQNNNTQKKASEMTEQELSQFVSQIPQNQLQTILKQQGIKPA